MAVKAETLIQTIAIEGDAQVNAALNKVGETGAAAFTKISDSAAQIGAGATDGLTKVQGAASNLAKGLQSAGKVVSDFFQGLQEGAKQGAVESSFNKSIAAATLLERAIGSVNSTVNTFLGRLALIATASGLGFNRLIRSARSAAVEFDKVTLSADTVGKQADAAAVQAAHSTEQYAQSVSALNRQLAAGDIEFDAYIKSLSELNAKQAEQEASNKRIRALESQIAIEQEQANKQLEKRQQLLDLQQRFGVQGAEAVLKIGRAAVTAQQLILKVLGPSLTTIADGITNFVAQNSQKIDTFLSEAIAKFTPLFKQIKTGFSNIDVGSVLNGISTVITNVFIPALQGIIGAANGVAKALNGLFGTNLTGQAVIAIALLLRLSGLLSGLALAARLALIPITALFGTFGLLAIPILAVVAAVAVLISRLSAKDWQNIQLVITNAFNGIIATVNNVISRIGQAWDNIRSGAASLWSDVTGIFNAGIQAIADLWNGLISVAQTAFGPLVTFFQGLWTSIVGIFNTAWGVISKGFSDGVAFIQSTWNDYFDWFNKKITTFVDWIKDAINWAKQLVGISGQASAANQANGGPAGGFAGGGRVRGAGTQTSDSIPAWLSRDEWVIKAKAASYYGHRIMAAINSMAIPREALRPQRFNMGGLVQALGDSLSFPQPRMAFASGGPVNGKAMRPLSLNIGGERFGGLMAPVDTAEALVKYSIRKNAKSAGRKQSWYGGK